jgi:hypothetical protein
LSASARADEDYFPEAYVFREVFCWHAICNTHSAKYSKEAEMIPLTLNDVQMLIAASVFLLGCICFLLGAFMLVSRGYSREIRALATHTAQLGQKGLANEISGLVNSASELVVSLNQLVKTASGVGIFLITLGMVMIGGSYWVIMQINWAAV